MNQARISAKIEARRTDTAVRKATNEVREKIETVSLESYADRGVISGVSGFGIWDEDMDHGCKVARIALLRSCYEIAPCYQGEQRSKRRVLDVFYTSRD